MDIGDFDLKRSYTQEATKQLTKPVRKDSYVEMYVRNCESLLSKDVVYIVKVLLLVTIHVAAMIGVYVTVSTVKLLLV